jgi:hypothetical protein
MTIKMIFVRKDELNNDYRKYFLSYDSWFY